MTTSQSASRVVMGHCPSCGGVLIQTNEYGVWEPFVCPCGWGEYHDPAKPDIVNRYRIERGFGVDVMGRTVRMPPIAMVETVHVDPDVL